MVLMYRQKYRWQSDTVGLLALVIADLPDIDAILQCIELPSTDTTAMQLNVQCHNITIVNNGRALPLFTLDNYR